MKSYSAIALFCEDLREEKGGSDIIVGILPDNVSFPQLPAVMPKLCIYIRIHLAPEFDPGGAIPLRLEGPGDQRIALGEVEKELIYKTKDDVKKKGAPLVGLISRVVMTPFQVLEPGRVNVVASVAGQDILCGSLNLVRV